MKIPIPPKLTNFIINGPFLVGWVYGIFAYEPEQKSFQESVNSMIIFLGYTVILLVNQFAAFLIVVYQPYFTWFNSVLALIYIIISGLRIYQCWMDKPLLFSDNPINKFINSLLNEKTRLT